MPALARIQVRMGTAATWTQVNPVLAAGEPGLEQEGPGATSKLKFGDGVTAWNSLPYLVGSGGGSGSSDATALGMPVNPITDPNAQRPAWATPAGIRCFFDCATDPVHWRDGDFNFQQGS